MINESLRNKTRRDFFVLSQKNRGSIENTFMENDYEKLSLDAHRKNRGKLEVKSKLPITNREELSIAYTPGVAAVCLEIEKNPEEARNLTSCKNIVAVITDGTAVLGLGDIGPEASLPVMEGKAALFKEFANVDAFPVALGTKDVEEIIATIKNIAPTFGGINLEDISAPRCFEIERRLKEILDIPVFHDDQHGTAIVVLAGLINALRVVGKKKENIKVVVNGAGAAGTAVAKLMHEYGVKNIIVCDTKGIISTAREDLNEYKKELATFSADQNLSGAIYDALVGADVFVGVSKGGLLTTEHVRTMAKDAIIFAMANPIPEIMPDEAKSGGARIVATGRSDFPNQINNVLVFPGIFRGALDSHVGQITEEMKLAAAGALASLVEDPTPEKIIPGPFDAGVAEVVAEAVKKFAF
jgi:malate dehydrogenase (oxaloacetate-decarboxylating)